MQWKKKLVSPEAVLGKIRPGMGIFIGTGVAEPRRMVACLMGSKAGNLHDLELIQIVSFGEALTATRLKTLKYRLKTFSPGSIAEEAITEGHVDLIPSRLSRIPELMQSPHIPVDAAFVQITPPDAAGNCSLGVAVDAARQAMERASLVVGEINPLVPRTYGDTFVHVSDFDYLVEADLAPIYMDRWNVDEVYDRIGGNVAALVENGSCLAFFVGPLFEALGRHLSVKRHLGVHSPFFTDALMELVQSGAVTNRKKETYRGKSLVSYALGTPELLRWLDQNPLVEFQGIDKVFNPPQIGRNPRFLAVVPAEQIDLSGRITLSGGKENVALNPAEVLDLFSGAGISVGGRTVVALPSRRPTGMPSVCVSLKSSFHRFDCRESVDTVATEYGVAHLKGLTLRERAQALIDLAHPKDRPLLVEQAKARRILYPDQIFLADSAQLYPTDLTHTHSFKNQTRICFRGIKPSDEEEMRRLFYRFSNEAVYSRYFGHITAMPHSKMQAYVNIDWRYVFSIVGLAEAPGQERVIAEARYIRIADAPIAEVVFVVDESCQGLGIATYLYQILVTAATTRGIRAFVADVLFSNIAMMKVFRKGGLPVKAHLEAGVYHLEIPLNPNDRFAGI